MYQYDFVEMNFAVNEHKANDASHKYRNENKIFGNVPRCPKFLNFQKIRK